jgi:hypothetical protein
VGLDSQLPETGRRKELEGDTRGGPIEKEWRRRLKCRGGRRRVRKNGKGSQIPLSCDSGS